MNHRSNGLPNGDMCRLVGWGMVCVVMSGVGLLPRSLAAEGDEEAALKEVQGRWVRSVQTADGRVKLVKEHLGNTTTLITYDATEAILHQHTSEFKLGREGKIRTLTFFNRRITAGPNAGQEVKAPTTFAYRVDENRFIEVYGLLPDDRTPPGLVVWEREKAMK